MRYKKAKQITIESFNRGVNRVNIDFGWKFRIYPRLRKQMKEWAREIIEEND